MIALDIGVSKVASYEIKRIDSNYFTEEYVGGEVNTFKKEIYIETSVHNIDYLMTWNCRHIDNAETKPIIRSVIISNGYFCPEICTPQELMGGELDEE